ncbi:MAG: O-antigen ligase family protein [Brumimicrobium sp.]
MFDKLLGLPAHKYLQVLGVLILAVGLPLNKVVMSIGTIWLASNLILNADFKSYWLNWKKSFIFWLIIAIFILHIAGLFYSSDIGYALSDIRTKLPFFVVPVALIGFPISKKEVHLVLKGFLISLFITSLINWLNLYISSSNAEYISFRDVSLFGSHIRYGLLIVMGTLVSFYLLTQRPKLFYLWVPLIIWFVYYTMIGQVFGGYVAFLFCLIGVTIYYISLVKNTLIKISLNLSILAIILVSSFCTANYFSENKKIEVFGDLPEKTLQGNPYYHDTTFLWFENGNHVLSYISEKELEASWNKRSTISYDSLDHLGHKIKSTLIRYLSSKGLTKDSVGMEELSSKDISKVEQGITNINSNSKSPFKRIESLKNQIRNYAQGGDPDGNSLLQRFEHWKAAVIIIKNNWLFGVGTGDVQSAFNKTYKRTNTKLNPNYWNRAHNQFLTFWVTFGILGFTVFIFFWLYLFIDFYKKKNLLGICFTLVAIASFLPEDTLETQQGVTFIALFIGLTLILNNDVDTKSPIQR